ncbi:MAG: hypothetical protein KJ069_02095 [Anaerolineae bacterium]|nr:hypothetical protein [Anaerolineae bacterium]
MEILLTIHSIVRWLVVVVGVIAFIKFLLGWLRKASFQPMDRGLMSGFVGLIDLQLLLGLILFIWGWLDVGLVRYRAEHAFTMILVVVLAHLSRRWRNADDTTKFRSYALIILGIFILVFAGIAVLPQGWGV